MGVMRQLLPNSTAWRGPKLLKILDALDLSFDRLRDFFDGIRRNAHPTTSDIMADDWDYEAPLYTASGGQSVGYLQNQMSIRWPDVLIVPLTFDEANMCGAAQCGEAMCADVSGLGPSYPVAYFYVRGSVDSRTKFNKLVATIARIFPAHMEPIYQITITNENNSSMLGLAECGVAQCGT